MVVTKFTALLKKRSARCPQQANFVSKLIKTHKEKFEESDRSKMPLVIFGDSLRNRDHVKFKEGLGELLLLDINEYKTSMTCNSCFNQDLENLKRGEGGDVKKIHQVLKY
ncbi:hypothetical protein BCV71DRAFT_280194 [Rhizopus microsporus]|uniref:Uncharacterized protein n=1 Tax=Rhizopus microsporus TaxID=58291 RepID=A0A1X0RL96_RHIZD|nr:hypothetical protein BCV71DRAFT_280194 [Rhizopus microsporus]